MSSGSQVIGRRTRSSLTARRQAAIALLAVLTALALLLVWRRLAGAIDHPLDSPSLAVLATVLCVVAWAARRLTASPRRGWLIGWPTAAIVAVGIAASVPGSPLLGLAAFWGIALAGEVYAWWPRAAVSDRAPEVAPAMTPVEPIQPPAEPNETVDEEPTEEAIPGDDVVQQFTRRQLADGGELVEGWLRVGLAAGQANASVHLGFCPPLARAPELVCEQVSGPAARIKLPQVLPHGARLDLKLSRAAETPQTIVLQFSARARQAG